jgi:phenylalanine-4-hydroxylase
MFVPRIAPEEAPQGYMARRTAISEQATGVDGIPATIDYRVEEHATWKHIHELLAPVWDRYAAEQMHIARAQLDLPIDHIPQLAFVSERLEPLTGFRYIAVPGTVPGLSFFGALGRRLFSSTQFIRWSGSIDYTEQPDLVHEVGGHAVSLANPELAELHQLAGLASTAAPDQLTEIAAVFWYSVEFGVVREGAQWKAYGTGLLSSPGELAWFVDNAEIRPLDVAEMIATPYDISTYQPIIFGASDLDEVHQMVGDYYRSLIANSTGTQSNSNHSEGASLVSP